MKEHILFLTGKLARKSLERIMETFQGEEFSYEVKSLPITVAALMTTDMIQRKLDDIGNADRIIIPGLCIGDLEKVSKQLGVPVERGPKELKELPRFFGKEGQPADLSRYDIRIFSEIVDAPDLSIEAVLKQAACYSQDGADIIDIGCLPGRDFPHLEDTVKALVADGYTVSIDSVDPEQLIRGGKAGADYLLSLKESTLWVADEVDAVPIVIPEHPDDIESLYRCINNFLERGKSFLADSIIDPIHFGFVNSIVRYHQLRTDYPDIELMMGTGNLSELTEADTGGINTILLGMMSELRINNLLTTQVSLHAGRSVAELNLGRRIMFRAGVDYSLPKGYDEGLMSLHDRNPFPYGFEEIKELSELVTDPNFRIQVTKAGIHIFNRDGLFTSTDPYTLFENLPALKNNAPHAYYIGVELGRAQIAWQLGKRYVQDEELDWGCAYIPSENSELEGHTNYKEKAAIKKARKEQLRENLAKRQSDDDADKK